MAPRPLLPYTAYEVGMTVIRARLLYLDSKPADAHPLVAAEKIAFQVRKIIEGVAFAALSAVEYRNRQMMSDHRGKGADKLLIWLDKKRLLSLPSARQVEPAPEPTPVGCLGSLVEAPDRNMAVEQLRAAYSRASALIHERHPERFIPETIEAECFALEEDGRRLRAWLWLHVTSLHGEAFLLDMDKHGTNRFLARLVPMSEPPPAAGAVR